MEDVALLWTPVLIRNRFCSPPRPAPDDSLIWPGLLPISFCQGWNILSTEWIIRRRWIAYPAQFLSCTIYWTEVAALDRAPPAQDLSPWTGSSCPGRGLSQPYLGLPHAAHVLHHCSVAPLPMWCYLQAPSTVFLPSLCINVIGSPTARQRELCTFPGHIPQNPGDEYTRKHVLLWGWALIKNTIFQGVQKLCPNSTFLDWLGPTVPKTCTMALRMMQWTHRGATGNFKFSRETQQGKVKNCNWPRSTMNKKSGNL